MERYECMDNEVFADLLTEVYSFTDYRVLATAMIPTNDEVAYVNTNEYDDPEDQYLVVLNQYMDTTLEVWRVDKYGKYPIQYNELGEAELDTDAHPPIYTQHNASYGTFTMAVDMLSTGRFAEWRQDRQHLQIGEFSL